jgi:hypothetical protein
MNIIDISDYGLEDTCHALNKIQCIADLFNVGKIGEGRNLSHDGLHGIHTVLLESVFELRTIINKEVDTVYEVYSLRDEVNGLKKELEAYRLDQRGHLNRNLRFHL